jgi:putative heme-binding domain-containing protein
MMRRKLSIRQNSNNLAACAHAAGGVLRCSAAPRILSVVRAAAAMTLLLLTSSSAVAQRDLKNIPIPDPELERQTFRVPEGFEVNLFAADPAIAKPIQMNFDVDGRLWLVSSEVYPQIAPGQIANDRVLILEDQDGDGVSDRTHVFADGLLIPTGIAPGDGGAWVANNTQLLHFADTDGDLKADSKRVVLSGFGTEDTHHILHTLRWGLDGSLYFNQSIYIHSHIETPWGVRRLNAGGIWQFRPETRELGVFMHGLVNSWGHDFDRFGQSFATDGAGGEGINYIIPGGYYFTAADAARILHGLNPGSPKHCGLEIVETPNLPPDWQGSAITNDFRGHRVCRFKLKDEGAGFISREQQEVIWSDHVAFRPVDVKQGPDGAIYIADWYNPIIQHGEVDFRDERRDHTHGRIWRVTWAGAKPAIPQKTSALSDTELFELLRSSDGFQRRAAKLVLRERGESVAPALLNWVRNTDADDHMKLEVLWCLQNIRVTSNQLLQQLLQSEDAHVRAAAVRVLTQWKFERAGSATQLAALVTDPDPRVRLEAIRGLSWSALQESQRETAVLNGTIDAGQLDEHDAPNRIEAALQALNLPMDPFLDYALWLTTRELSSAWLPAFEENAITFGGDIDQVVFAFRAVGGNAPVDLLLDRVYLPGTDDAERGQLTELICSSANPNQLGALFEVAARRVDLAVLSQIESTSASLNTIPIVADDVLPTLIDSKQPAVRSLAMMAAGRWQVAGLRSLLSTTVLDSSAAISDRIAAARGIIASKVPKSVNDVVHAIQTDDAPLELRAAVLSNLVAVQPGRSAKLLQQMLPSFAAQKSLMTDVMAAFLQQKRGVDLLTQALTDSSVSADTGREMLRVLRQSGRAIPELETLIRSSANIKSRKALSQEERSALLSMALNESSAAEGEIVFRNEQFGCLKCHAIGGAGGKVGPDMVSLGGSAQPDYLLEALLNPNAKVKENYHTVIIATKDGRVVSGVQTGQSGEAVTIRTAEDVQISVPRDEIDEIVPGVSLMPEGLVDSLTNHELAAIVRFLSELGRTPAFTLSRRRIARTWETMIPTKPAAFRLRRTSYAVAATDDPAFDWKRLITKVDGSLPLDAVPTVAVKNRSAGGTRGVGFARTYLKVSTAGQIQMQLNSTEGLEVRIDDLPIDVNAVNSLNLDTGVHRVTVSIDKAERTEPVVLELIDAPPGPGGNSEFVN